MSVEGSTVSLEELLEHERWVRNLAADLVHDPGAADDLVQRTWLAALQSPRARRPRAWLRSVVHNLWVSDGREERNRLDYESRSFEARHSRGPAEELFVRERRELVVTAVRRLEAPYRDVLLLYYFEGSSSVEIAARLGIPEGTVRWRLKRGREELRERLGPERASPHWLGALIVGFGEREASVGSSWAASVLRRLSLWKASLWQALLVLAVVSTGVFFLVKEDELPRRSTAVSSPSDSAPSVADRGAAQAPVRVPGALPEQSTVPELEAQGERESAAPHERATLRVVDLAGRSVAEAEVRIVRADGVRSCGRTAADGTLALELLDADYDGSGYQRQVGCVGLAARIEGGVWSQIHHYPRELVASTGGALQLQLDPLPLGASLSGTVRDPAGAPIAGVLVLVRTNSGLDQRDMGGGIWTTGAAERMRTDATGRYEVGGIPASTVEVSFSAEGYVDARSTLRLLAGEAHGLDGDLARGAELVGQVRDEEGEPLAKVEVGYEPLVRVGPYDGQSLPGYRARLFGFAGVVHTDRDGRFRLTGIPPGPRQLYALDAEGSRVAFETVELDAASVVEWSPRVRERLPLAVHVADASDRPLAGMSVYAQTIDRERSWRRIAITDEDGFAFLVDWREFPIYLTAYPPLLLGEPGKAVTLHRFTEEPVELTWEPSPTRFLRGLLLDEHEAPLQAADLIAYKVGSTASAKISTLYEDGSFEGELPPGVFRVFAAVPGRGAFFAGRVDLTHGDAPPLRIVLPESVQLIPPEERSMRATVELVAVVDPSRPHPREVPIFREEVWPDERLEVLPGNYVLRIEGQQADYRFQVPAGEASFEISSVPWQR